MPPHTLDRVLDELFTTYEEVMKGGPRSVSPAVVLVATLAVATVAALSSSATLGGAAMVSAVAQAVVLKVDLGRIVRPLALVALYAALVSIPPLVVQQAGFSAAEGVVKWSDPSSVTAFLLRVVAPSLALLSAASHLGWQGLVEAFSSMRLPPSFTFSLILMVRSVPMLIREVARMLAAREARRVTRSYRALWLTLSTVTGDLIARSLKRAVALGMVIEARGGIRSRAPGRCFKPGDALFMLVSLTPLLAPWLIR